MSEDDRGFWEKPEQVERFASREPDRRLRELVDGVVKPGSVRVLDLGCAGGRNTELLARHGFDVWAVDASEAMVRATRDRLRDVLGPGEAERRVRIGRMDDLAAFDDAIVRLVVALGVYHNAGDPAEWDRALSETARILERGGLALVSNFAPGTDLTGEGMEPVPGSAHLYRGAPSGALTLLAADELDEAMARHGLRPEVPTETVEAESETGRRVTVNGLYRRTEGG